jgi:hypothetical protein
MGKACSSVEEIRNAYGNLIGKGRDDMGVLRVNLKDSHVVSSSSFYISGNKTSVINFLIN